MPLISKSNNKNLMLFTFYWGAYYSRIKIRLLSLKYKLEILQQGFLHNFYSYVIDSCSNSYTEFELNSYIIDMFEILLRSKETFRPHFIILCHKQF